MAIYMIGYDLNRPGQNYSDLIATIKSAYPHWWHCLDSTWLVETSERAIQIRDRLRPHLDRSDELLVAEMAHGNAAWAGFNDECSNWLVTNLS